MFCGNKGSVVTGLATDYGIWNFSWLWQFKFQHVSKYAFYFIQGGQKLHSHILFITLTSFNNFFIIRFSHELLNNIWYSQPLYLKCVTTVLCKTCRLTTVLAYILYVIILLSGDCNDRLSSIFVSQTNFSLFYDCYWCYLALLCDLWQCEAC